LYVLDQRLKKETSCKIIKMSHNHHHVYIQTTTEHSKCAHSPSKFNFKISCAAAAAAAAAANMLPPALSPQPQLPQRKQAVKNRTLATICEVQHILWMADAATAI